MRDLALPDPRLDDLFAITDRTELGARVDRERAADIVDALNRATPARAAALLLLLPNARAVDLLDQSGLDAPARIVAAMPDDQAPSLLDAVSADRLADIFRAMSKPARSALLARLDPDVAARQHDLLRYPPETAGSIMTTEFVSVPSSWSVGQVLDHLRAVESCRETIYSIFVTDPVSTALVRVLPLRRLISADPQLGVLDAAPDRRLIAIPPLASRDEATRLISKYDLLAVPVIDEGGCVIGIVTVDDVIDAIVQQSTDEVQRFGGSEALGEPYLRIGFLTMIRKRAGWLCVLFLSEMLTASAMQGFEGELEKAIVLTLFIPLIMSSGGNSGSQATSLIIRALALNELALRDWWRVARRELPTGLLLGAILGLIGMIRISLWQHFGLYDYGVHWPRVAMTVGAALIGIVTFGSFTGSMLPFVLQRVGFDPATASAPFVATLVDVTGLVIYFGIAAVILHGTLL